MNKRIGARTGRLAKPPAVLGFAAVGGHMEGAGPLGGCFDEISEDHFWGQKTWEQDESVMQRHALRKALEKATLHEEDMDCVFAGDLQIAARQIVLDNSAKRAYHNGVGKGGNSYMTKATNPLGSSRFRGGSCHFTSLCTHG